MQNALSSLCSCVKWAVGSDDGPASIAGMADGAAFIVSSMASYELVGRWWRRVRGECGTGSKLAKSAGWEGGNQGPSYGASFEYLNGVESLDSRRSTGRSRWCVMVIMVVVKLIISFLVTFGSTLEGT